MATIQVRNLPDEAVQTLKVRAAKSGQSLQEFMREFLIEETSKPTISDLLDEVMARHDPAGPEIPIDEVLRGIDETWE